MQRWRASVRYNSASCKPFTTLHLVESIRTTRSSKTRCCIVVSRWHGVDGIMLVRKYCDVKEVDNKRKFV